MSSTFRADIRAATVQMLKDFAGFYELRLQVYEGRPASINPPTAFLDVVREQIVYDAQRLRIVQADVVVLHGLFDSRDAVIQADEFTDAWMGWTWDRFHAAGTDTSYEPVAIVDDPTFVPEWLPDDRQRTYFSTRITLEGRSWVI